MIGCESGKIIPVAAAVLDREGKQVETIFVWFKELEDTRKRSSRYDVGQYRFFAEAVSVNGTAKVVQDYRFRPAFGKHQRKAHIERRRCIERSIQQLAETTWRASCERDIDLFASQMKPTLRRLMAARPKATAYLTHASIHPLSG